MLIRSLGASGPFLGVESHVLLPAGLIGSVAARTRRIPHVTYAHGSDVIATARRSWFHRSAARYVARSASAVVTNSLYMASFVERLGVIPAVVSPGVDLLSFSPGSRRDARLQTGLPADARIAMFVGRSSQLKGADLFTEAVSKSAGWLGVIVGTGELEPAIAARHPAIVRAGTVPPDEIPSWLRSADVVVAPSRNEGLGLVAIEALACGIPVIASEVGGLAETIHDGVNGLLVVPGNSKAIIAALERIADPDVRTRLAEAAPASVAQHSIEHTTDAMAAVWAGVGVRL
jgi:glycosyltransferase involved in cell wall biosynthesis